MKNVKALVLFSGGLDSQLAVKMLQSQNIEINCICFVSNFYNAEKAKSAVKNLRIKLQVINIGKNMLELVKNPLNGYGKNMNPCIDCHGMMFKKAGEIAINKGFDFIATGEVLGQRPFSQNKESLNKVAKLAGVEILRPLSAKLLNETNIEKSKKVIREKLGKIQGKCRKQQFELAKEYNLTNFPTPDGGCLLTNKCFNNRLLEIFEYYPECFVDDIEFLKHGRVFWSMAENKEMVLIVVGRHKKDNENLKNLAQENDIVLELNEIVGPLTILRNYKPKITNSKLQIQNIFKINIPEKLNIENLKLRTKKSVKEILDFAGLLTGWYSVKARGKDVVIKIKKYK